MTFITWTDKALLNHDTEYFHDPVKVPSIALKLHSLFL